MNLIHLSDTQLIFQTKSLVEREREILTQILQHLREIERRRLYCGHSSLFAYSVEELKYSESQAQRRINAMRLLKSMPEIEEKIASGALNLTHLNIVGALPLDTDDRREILRQIENTPVREAAQIVTELHPEMKKAIKDILIEDPELQEKVAKMKGLLAHSHPGISNTQLFDLMLDWGFEKLARAPSAPKGVSRTVVREVWQAAEGKCEVCGSVHALQIDHIHPKALGGGNERENLRLLCRNCNQRAAVKVYGAGKMARYWN